ncbi:MAG TPA: hypothetical protein PKE27_05465 [Povalibacter sp.]|uniref:hypothetical protein n=1 Tax=Povalibacter sp. TaxID=1962978 RepID=UPI002BFFA678|nr:hypothetical protein [Povalibacter sp.]HMN43997.1 hypothetical protein [Povalibacter sp.]
MRIAICIAAAALCGAFAGCVSVGPGTVPRDRLDYSESITESWKRQNLLNIVKLRYLDPPVFVDVGQIVSGYTLETGMTVGGQVSSGNAVQGNSATLGGSGRFTDRPTITYVPMTGTKFMSGLIMPIPPDAMFYSIQSGWAADVILTLGVGAINGLKNASRDRDQEADPRFLRVAELLRQIQISGSVGLRLRKGPGNEKSTIVVLRAPGTSTDTLAQIRELRSLLGLAQDATEFTLVYGDIASNDREIAVHTRSLLHVMSSLGQRVEVPATDLSEGRATFGLSTAAPGATGTFRIHSSVEEPQDAYVSVRYRGTWFWIDDRDLRSKGGFAIIMLLFTLTDQGPDRALPLLTIPTG